MTRRLPDPGSSEWIGQAYDAYAAGLYRYAHGRIDQHDREPLPIRPREASSADGSAVVNDDLVEEELRRYRLPDPPAALRDAVLAARPQEGMSPREWAAIAASLLLAATFYWLADVERARTSAILGSASETASAFEEPLR